MIARKADGSLVTSDEFALLSKEEIVEFVTASEKDDLIAFLCALKGKRAFLWQDRMLLQMVDKSPFTYWASDRTYKVKLWAGQCSSVYRREMLGKEFYEFMSRYERRNAMEDSIKLIDYPDDQVRLFLADFENYYTMDKRGASAEVGLVTNSIQLVDEDTGEKLYAEIGVPIDLREALKKFEVRQEKFKQEITDFEKECMILKADFKREIENLYYKIGNDRTLTGDRKRELKSKCRNTSETINHEIDEAKAHSATNFKGFIDDTNKSIQIAIDEIESEIDDHTATIQQRDIQESERKREEIKSRIEMLKQDLSSKSNSLLINILSIPMNDNLKDQREDRLKQIRKEMEKFSHELSNILEGLPQCPSIMFESLERAIDAIQAAIISYIAKQGGLRQ